MKIKNLEKTAKRILKAIKEKERIILYGDSDLDGVGSVIILGETIKNLGGKVSVIHFPDREKEGYGITRKSLSYLKTFSPALLIAVDCGIGNFEEIKEARKIGFSVIVIDHHKVLGRLPDADIIVDPKQKSDNYPFKELATVGLVFKLSEIMFDNMPAPVRESFLELVALATIADMMPRESDNRMFIDEGLFYIENSWRPGIRALMSLDFLRDYSLNEKVSKIISMLNVRDVENGMPTSFSILTGSSAEELKRMIKKLKKKNEWRKIRVAEITEEIRQRDLRKGEEIVFEGEPDWEYPLISSAASIICREAKKPTFIYKKLEKESQGTVRVFSKIDSVDLMEKCKKYVLTYGGHPKASGFRIKNENLDAFKICLIKSLGELDS